MSTVAIAKLKASLSAYLRRVQKGEEVTITDHGRPVARILAIPDMKNLDAHMKELVRTGRARAGTGRLPEDFWDLPRPKVPAGWIQRFIDEEREDRV